ncbi:heme exporter protein CcmB [Marivirga sp. S37H4]|uniref:Heme exporter protein CcmB n=1 Tax=Marivirga aurantiaca TaxID=2802615 RepID=A0A934WZZ9_9BACT|nr:heme exporter protein CcmB [Marivirga aurantiaca]MBK6265920.1 heme exporter protein CcmB [Marivirga aurantiaca]
MLQQVLSIINKEVKLEWRNKTAFNSIVLYLVSTIFICYLSFNVKTGQMQAVTWNALFWIIIVFANINGVAKSFLQEGEGRMLYYYTLCKPQVILSGKLIFNILLSVLIAIIGFVVYAIILGNPVVNHVYFLLTILLASIGFAGILTLVSGIVSKANNSTALLAVLSFPILLPILMIAIRLSKNAIDGIDASLMNEKLFTLLSVDAVVIATAYLLFPFIWRS